MNFTIDKPEHLYARGTSKGIAISFTINGTRTGQCGGGTLITGLGSYNAVPGINYLTLGFGTWQENETNEFLIELINAPSLKDVDEGEILHTWTQNDFLNQPDKEVIEIILNCKGYFPELEPLLVKCESINRIVFKDIPEHILEDVIKQKTKQLKEELQAFDNQVDAEVHLKSVIEELSSYIGGTLETIEAGTPE